jgi:hypothetical protein
VGALASLFAFIGRSAAHAADALIIGPNGVNIDNLNVAKSLTVAGNAELKTPAGANTLDVQSAVRVNEANHPKGLALYVTADSDPAGKGVEVRHTNGSQGIGIGYNTIYATGSTTDQDLILKARGKSPVKIQSDLAVEKIQSDLTVEKSLTVKGADGAKGLRVSPTTAGANLLDIQAGQNREIIKVAASAEVPAWEGKHETGLALYVTADSGGAGNGVEFRHSNGTQGIGFGYNTIYATGTHPNQPLILKARGTGTVQIAGTLQANAVIDENPLRNRMYPAGTVVYQEIFDVLGREIQKIGNPSYDNTTYRQSLWNDRHMIKFGGNNEADGNGALVTIPTGYDTVWVRVLGDRWNVIHAYFLDNGDDLGRWTGGRRSANSYAPDGTLADGYDVAHQWLPIPTRGAGRLALISKPNTDQDFWISGLAFSKNPWGHAAQSGLGYHWAVNGGDATGWDKDGANWNSDVLAKINPKTKAVLKVPVVPSGRDKLLYLIEHNSNWNGAMHTAVTVAGKPVERFMATYDNPFSRHWNSKSYERYIATRIPNQYIPSNARFLDVIIDMTKQNTDINFREIGTHDLAVPWP